MKANKQEDRGTIRPRTIFVALIAVNLVLGLISLTFPEDGLNITEKFSLKFLSFDKVFSSGANQDSVVNIDDVLDGINLVEADSSDFNDSDTITDDIKKKLGSQIVSSISYDSATGKLKNLEKRSIQFPKENPDALDYFFEALMTKSSTEVIRILHYGDSQLEGDRVTDYLRNRFQMIFGGSGPGFVLPLEPTAGARRSAYVRQSVNFAKDAIYKQGSKAENNRYGLGGACFRMKGVTKNIVGYDTVISTKINPEDSTSFIDTAINPLFEEVKQTTAFLEVNNSKSSYNRVRSYNNIRLLYSAKQPFKMRISADTFSEELTVVPSEGLAIQQWNFETHKKLRLDFLEGEFPKLYGLALDGSHGVAVDNFPMRGSAGLGYDGMNRDFYATQLQEMNVKLIVLQYGVNVIPGILKDYTYYKNMLKAQLKAMKAAHPDISILIIGPSDMSMNQDGQYVSYPNIPLIRDAMKQAAFESGCAFWDLYEAMGGLNAMSSWVKGGLAAKDYTHFSHNGARFVSEMLFEAILEQLQNKGYLN